MFFEDSSFYESISKKAELTIFTHNININLCTKFLKNTDYKYMGINFLK